MFKKSFLLVLGILILVIVSAFTTQLSLSRNLPSSFDSGLSIQEAFKTSKTPILVEFYTDACTTCQRVTPIVHDVVKSHFKTRLTPVMMNLENPKNQPIASLFGVETLPAVFIFDVERMKKHAIESPTLESAESLKKALNDALSASTSLSSGVPKTAGS